MTFDILPVRTGTAAENMALDFLLLQRYPHSAAARFRHYNWRGPAFTFGYSQKIAFIRACLPIGEAIDLCRRQTGGGLVDHRDDWTYALVIPRGHPLEEQGAVASYRAVHEAIAAALQHQDVPSRLAVKTNSQKESAKSPAAVCFERAEPCDLIHAASGAKIAGAAQKRNKNGLLFQGSIWKPAIGAPIDWEKFHDDLVAALAGTIGAPPTPTPWPDFNEDELGGLTEQYASAEWNESR